MFELRPVERPYPGLRAFEPHEAEIFFGREAHTDRLLGILQRERFLAVIGPSGSGKSSLVRAGLLPGLAMGSLGTGSDWRIALLRPGDRPMRSLAAALLQPEVLGRHLLSHDGEPDAADIAALEAELRRGPLALATLCAEAQRRHRADAADDAAATDFNLLVLVDQFEEIFTYADAGGQQAADESDAFVSLLLAARADAKSRAAEPGLHVALTMRTDFLGNCVRFFDLPEAITQAQYLTPRLNRDEIELAITGPAALWGGRIEPTLVAELINATGRNLDQLPLVQHALARMWSVGARLNPEAPFIDWEVLSAIGGIEGAIANHANELWESLNSKQRDIAIGIFTALVEQRAVDGGMKYVRRPQSIRNISLWLDVNALEVLEVVDVFAESSACFLQRSSALGESAVVDLSHEALIRQWPDLQCWIGDEAERTADFSYWLERCISQRANKAEWLNGADLAKARNWVEYGTSIYPRGSGGRPSMLVQPNSQWALRYQRNLQGTNLRSRFPSKEFNSIQALLAIEIVEAMRFIRNSSEAESKKLVQNRSSDFVKTVVVAVAMAGAVIGLRMFMEYAKIGALGLLLSSFLVAVLSSISAIRGSTQYLSSKGDSSSARPQKIHSRVAPRIGGACIGLGVLVGVLLLSLQSIASVQIYVLLCAGMLVLGVGLLEDVTKRVSLRQRSLVTVLAAVLVIWFGGMKLERTDFLGIDAILIVPFIAPLLTVSVVLMIVRSIDIVDGFNGLASMCAAIIFASLGFVAWQVGDRSVALLSIIALGAVLGFFVLNYPFGLIFLGDGGTSLIGFLAAQLGVMLVQRNVSVSPIFPLLLCAYPIVELFFTMYRRRAGRGTSFSLHDTAYLHTLVYRRLVRRAIGSSDSHIHQRANWKTSPYLWLLCCCAAVPAVLWWDNSAILSLWFAGFCVLYAMAYRIIVKFRVQTRLQSRGQTAVGDSKATHVR